MSFLQSGVGYCFGRCSEIFWQRYLVAPRVRLCMWLVVTTLSSLTTPLKRRWPFETHFRISRVCSGFIVFIWFFSLIVTAFSCCLRNKWMINDDDDNVFTLLKLCYSLTPLNQIFYEKFAISHHVSRSITDTDIMLYRRTWLSDMCVWRRCSRFGTYCHPHCVWRFCFSLLTSERAFISLGYWGCGDSWLHASRR